MRLDQLLKYSGLFKNRDAAKYYCSRKLVKVNGVSKKATAQVENNDVVSVRIGDKNIEFCFHEEKDNNVIKIGFELIKGEGDA